MPLVHTVIDDGVAVVTLTSPPVNLGNGDLRASLLRELSALPSDISGVVLISGLRDFYAGSDIREFDGPLPDPQLPQIIDVIENLPPVVVALSGFALGGGFELALGCDVRIATPTVTVGLPETTLGILPGAGGTVRLPRLIGVPMAIEMISSGRHVRAEEALAIGIVDAIVDEESLREQAISQARVASKRRLVDAQAPQGEPSEVEAAVRRASRRGRARPNVVEAVELIVQGVKVAGREALAHERAAFDRLRSSAEAANLRYLFFSTRAAAKATRVGARAPELTTIGVAGAGTMGSRIAAACLEAGLGVVMFDSNADALARARDAFGGSEGARLTDRLEDLTGVDLVIDAVFEDMTVKQELFTAIERVVPPTTVLASNTSYLDLDEIAGVLGEPDRFVGLHFFNPADRNRLVEIIRTATSSDRSVAAVAELSRLLGKSPIPSRVAEGFVANRVYADYRSQVEFLIEDGAWPDQVDRALQEFGFAMGPFAVADMSGLDIAWARRKRLALSRDERERYVVVADRLCEIGQFGRKTGAGYYDYSDPAHPVPDARAVSIIRAVQAESGRKVRSDIDADEIVQRAISAMVVAAAEVVGNGTAERASDIDVAITTGFAFPKWHGGPLRYAAHRSEAWLVEGLTHLHRSDPIRYASLEPATRGKVPEAVESVLLAVR